MTTLTLVRAGRILTPLEEISHGAILVADGVTRAIGPERSVGVPAGARIVDCGDLTVAPGFVDVHCHGSGGDSAMDGGAATARVARFITRHGVTSWLPTLTPRATLSELAEIIRANRVEASQPPAGADVLGVHLEGPFLNPKRPGALRAEWFRPASLEELDSLLAAGQGRVRLVTLAPERPGGLDLVRRLVERGTTASIGHSDARLGEALAAVSAGVSHATHTFNAMPPFHHREPGLVGAVLSSDQVRCELIADGVHVDPLAMRLLIKAKGATRIVLITDAVAPAGLGDGQYEFDGRPITVQQGKALLADGTIAGSVATFDGNLRRLVQECGVSRQQALVMATLVPALAIGMAHRKGSLVGGRDADLVALDAALRVRLTMVRGTIVYDARTN